MNNIKTFVITMKGQTQRQQSFKKELSTLNLDYNIFYGINGSQLEFIPYISDKIYLLHYKPANYTYVYDTRKILNKEILNGNQLGCSLSHIELYKQLMTDNCYAYLIIEDDVIKWLTDEKIKKYLDNLPDLNSFDVAMLCISDFPPYNKHASVNEYYSIPYKNFFNRTTAYIVTKTGANKLLMSNYPCVGLPADDNISNLYIMTNDFRVIIPNEPLFVHDIYYDENNISREKR